MKYTKTFAIIFIIIIALIIAAMFLFPREKEPVIDNGSPANKNVEVFFGNTQKNPNAIDCGAVFPVSRTIAANSGYNELLNQLFAGPTADETAQGYTSFFTSATADILISVKISGDTAYVNLKDLRSLIPNASTSCGSQGFLSEITTTLEQDGKIKKTIFAINGDPAPFYEWLQIGCSPETTNCDPTPFK